MEGESEYESPIRGDYEVAVKAVVDWVEQRADVDAAKIGLWGVSLGGYYAPRAADYLRILAEEWELDAARKMEPFNAERLVIILMAVNDQQLQIHFGPKLKDDLGLEGPPVTKELLVPHFLPYARKGELREGLVSLLRGTEKWIAEHETTKNAEP